MDDVARAAGVSRKTVSRVINDTDGVSNETRDAVVRAVRKLRYAPHPTARSLAGGHSRCVGVVIGHGADYAFSNPHLGQVLHGIGRTITARGFQTVLLTQDAPASAEHLVQNRQVDGFMFLGVTIDDPLVATLLADGVPIILTCEHTDDRIVWVDVDNRKGARQATEHLLSLGHDVIGFVNGPPDHASCHARLAGYRVSLEAAGTRFDPRLVMEGDFSEESGFRTAMALLEARPDVTAVFAASDLMAIGVLRAIQEAGLRVPDDLSVVGFDGIRLARYLSPPLTTIRQSAVEKGKLASEMLVQRLVGEQVRRRPLLLEPELLVRSSTGPRRTRAAA